MCCSDLISRFENFFVFIRVHSWLNFRAMNEWNIQSRATPARLRPAVCRQAAVSHAAARRVAGLRRSDVCEPCWQKQFAGDAARRSGYFDWQGIFEVPPPMWTLSRRNRRDGAAQAHEQNDPRTARCLYSRGDA